MTKRISEEKINKLKSIHLEFKKKRFMKICMMFTFLSVIIFTITVFVVFCITGNEPSTLVDSFFAFFGLEGGAMAIIKTSESVSEAFTKKSSDIKNHIDDIIDDDYDSDIEEESRCDK